MCFISEIKSKTADRCQWSRGTAASPLTAPVRFAFGKHPKSLNDFREIGYAPAERNITLQTTYSPFF